MRLLSASMHIGDRDFETIAKELGHEVRIKCYSFHSHFAGRNRVELDYDPNRVFDDAYCREYCACHAREFENIDAFYVFYPPAQALLFAPTGKPIICHIPIRYDAYSGNLDRFAAYNGRLGEMIDAGQLRILANNRFDQGYTAAALKAPVEYVPNLCDYHQTGWTGTADEILLDDRYRFFGPGEGCRRLGDFSYDWRSLAAFRFCLCVPYQVSWMSFYERYSMGMPMVVPSREILVDMIKHGSACTEVYWNRWMEPGYPLFDHLLEADYYSGEWPGIMCAAPDNLDSLQAVSELMLQTHSDRRSDVLEQWERILSRLPV